MSKRSVFVIPFSRLSLSWMGEQEECLSRGGQAIGRALQMMEEREDFHFLVEEMVFVDAYLKAHPEALKSVRKRVGQGRLEVGAGWTEIGQNLQVGEDLARNLLYGKRYAAEVLGGDSPTVCLGDPSGWTPQYPQIARKCGVDNAVVTGAGPGDATLLGWQGSDGSTVRVWHTRMGYSTLWKALHGEPGRRREYGQEVETELARSAGLLPILWGSDLTQMSEAVLDDLEGWAEAEDLDVTFGTPTGYFQKVGAPEGLPVKAGEHPPDRAFIEPLSPGVAGLNAPAVYGLLRAEQVAAGAGALCGFAYPKGALEEAWLRQLEAMDFRDRGTGADEAQERKVRSQQMAIWTASEVARAAERAVAEQVDGGDGPPGTVPIVVFNPSSWARTDAVTAHVTFYGEEQPTDFSRYEVYRVVDRGGKTVPSQEVFGRQVVTAEIQILFVAAEVPPGGYATYYLVPNPPDPQQLMGVQAPGMVAPEFPEPTFAVEDVEERVSEPYRGVRIGRRFTQAVYHLEVDEITGWVTVTDRRTDRVLVDGMHLVGREETMREGLARYDYTGRKFEMDLDRVDLEESGEVRAVLLLSGRMLTSPFEERIFLYRDLDRVDVALRLHWRDEKPVRVQMVFPMGNEDADIHYGVPYGSAGLGDRMPGCASRTEGGVQQRACQGWIAVDGDGDGVVLAGDRRAFEFEGREVRGDLLRSCIDPSSYAYRRMWRSYPDVCTVRYAIRGYAGDFRSALAHRDGWGLNQPLSARSVYDTASGRSLPDRLSFVALEGPGLVTTAFKPAEDGEGFVLRAYETLGQACEARLTACRKVRSVREADMLERPIGDLDPDAVRFDPFEIKTLRLVLEEER